MTAPPALVRHLGRVDYEPTWRRMQAFTESRKPSDPDEIWVLEHPPVFTLGQAGREEHLLAPGDIPVVNVDRGGQVTYHGPGQLVGYLLLDLRRLGLGIKAPVQLLEQAVIDWLDEQGISAKALADQIGVDITDINDWRDEALLLNLANFGPEGQRILTQAGIVGLADLTACEPQEFHDKVVEAAYTLGLEAPTDLAIQGWYDQAHVLAED